MKRPGRPGTPVPSPLPIPSGARQRQSYLQWSGTGGWLARTVRLVTRRFLIVPPGLDTLCQWPNRQFRPLKAGPSVVAVLPEHNLRAFPGSRSTFRSEALTPNPSGGPVPSGPVSFRRVRRTGSVH